MVVVEWWSKDDSPSPDCSSALLVAQRDGYLHQREPPEASSYGSGNPKPKLRLSRGEVINHST